jgi:NAD(P)-dependent dehydrogenase (short-subunit alcohol dehydrogenase family)
MYSPFHWQVFYLAMDVTNRKSIESAVSALSASDGPLAYSNGALDVLINNAGVGAPPGRAGKGAQNMFLQTELTTAEDMINVLSTNVAAVVQVTSKWSFLFARMIFLLITGRMYRCFAAISC